MRAANLKAGDRFYWGGRVLTVAEVKLTGVGQIIVHYGGSAGYGTLLLKRTDELRVVE